MQCEKWTILHNDLRFINLLYIEGKYQYLRHMLVQVDAAVVKTLD